MKWLIAVFALCMSMDASAAEYISVKADARPNHCAFFRGNFESENVVGTQNKYRPWIACKLVEGVGAECWLKGHGMAPALPDPAKFKGSFGWLGDKFFIKAFAIESENFNVRLVCDSPNSCDLFHFWNSDVNVGYGCDMIDYTPPAKPAPQAPPLLRKNAEPYKAPLPAKAPGEIGV